MLCRSTLERHLGACCCGCLREHDSSRSPLSTAFSDCSTWLLAAGKVSTRSRKHQLRPRQGWAQVIRVFVTPHPAGTVCPLSTGTTHRVGAHSSVTHCEAVARTGEVQIPNIPGRGGAQEYRLTLTPPSNTSSPSTQPCTPNLLLELSLIHI